MSGALTAAYEWFISADMDLIDELKSLRELKGVSQSDVAAVVGCNQATVSLWENEKAKPSGSARILLQGFIARMREMPDAARKERAA